MANISFVVSGRMSKAALEVGYDPAIRVVRVGDWRIHDHTWFVQEIEMQHCAALEGTVRRSFHASLYHGAYTLRVTLFFSEGNVSQREFVGRVLASFKDLRESGVSSGPLADVARHGAD